MWGSIITSLITSFAQQAGANYTPVARQRLRNARILVWFGLILLLAGIGLVVWGVTEILAGQGSLRWPSTTGHIIESYVQEVPTPNITTYYAHIRYAYNDGSQAHVGKKVSYNDTPSNLSACERVVAKYPTGMDVKVYYDPDNTGTSVLEPGLEEGAWLRIAAIVSWLPIIALAVLWIGASMRKKALREIRPQTEKPDSDAEDRSNPYRFGQ